MPPPVKLALLFGRGANSCIGNSWRTVPVTDGFNAKGWVFPPTFDRPDNAHSPSSVGVCPGRLSSKIIEALLAAYMPHGPTFTKLIIDPVSFDYDDQWSELGFSSLA
jgi:hypothetical protein